MRRAALIASAALVIAATVLIWVRYTRAPALSARNELADSSLGGVFAIAAPTNGYVTDGGLIISPVSPRPLTLIGVRLRDHGAVSTMRVVQARLVALKSDLNQVIGIRQGLPSQQLDAGQQLALGGATIRRAASRDYEIVLGLRAPGPGLWDVTSVQVTYRSGTTTQSQAFPHNLTVCSANQAACGPVGGESVAVPTPTHTVDTTSCAGSRSYVSGRPGQLRVATNLSSNWVGSGGTIEFSQTRTASFSATSSFSAQLTATATFPFLFAEVEASARLQYSVTVTYRVSTTQVWSYYVTIPPNSPALRVTVFVYAWALPTITVTLADSGGSCHAIYEYGTVYAPDSNTNPHDEYCVTAVPFPGVAVLGPDCHARI